MWLSGDGGEDDQVAGTDQPFGAVVHGDPAGGARLFKIAAEARGAGCGQVVHAYLVERPTGASQERVDVARYQAHPDEPHTGRSAANTADAAVLVALTIDASRQANGYPVSGSLRISTPDALGTPAATFSGKLEIHLRPSTRICPPMEAGSAMIRAAGRSGNRRKYDGGFTDAPAPCSRYVVSTNSTISFSRPSSTRWTWAPEITANRGTGGRSAHSRDVAAERVVVIPPSPHRLVTRRKVVPGRPYRRGSRAAPRRPPCCAQCGCCRPASGHLPARTAARFCPRTPR